MLNPVQARHTVALVLVFVTALMTSPVSATDLTKTRVPLGAVSVAGAVELRGITVLRDGTIFSGDSLRSSDKAYAKVSLAGGQNIEVGQRTNLTFNRDVNEVRVSMTSGDIGFFTTSKAPLTIDVDPYVVVSSEAGTGNVALLNGNSLGVHVVDGSVMVRNKKDGTAFEVSRGQERLFSMPTQTARAGVTQMASNSPTSPSPKLGPPSPQTGGTQTPVPGGQTTGPSGGGSCGICMDTPAWFAVLGTLAAGGVAIGLIVYYATRSTSSASPSTP